MFLRSNPCKRTFFNEVLSVLKKTGLILLFDVLILSKVGAQDLKWKLGLFTFFDNTEFAGSAFQIPQTMSGVVLSPEAGLGWDSVHRISAGFHLLHEFGSVKTIGSISPTAYYNYNKGPFRFMMGAFPREYALDRYPRVFFRDSVFYYRPNINGMFWEVRRSKDYFNLWLDWSSRQTKTEREAFFVGFSGRYYLGNFFMQHYNYMYHFSGLLDPSVIEALHDNILMFTGGGVDLSGKTIFDRLEASAGWVSGMERARADQSGWIKRNGILVEARIAYKSISLMNSYYKGDGLFQFYNDHGNDLYWGDAMYRARTYDRSDLCFRFMKNRKINLDLVYSLHFAEGNVYHEQVLKVRVDFNNY